jgi:phosphate-selective porin OprO/OprP
MFGSEMYWHNFNSSTADDPMFFGGEVVASYMITGESRPYHTVTSILGFVPIKKSVFKGGPGAWEVLFRASTLDLDGGVIRVRKVLEDYTDDQLVSFQRYSTGGSVWLWSFRPL